MCKPEMTACWEWWERESSCFFFCVTKEVSMASRLPQHSTYVLLQHEYHGYIVLFSLRKGTHHLPGGVVDALDMIDGTHATPSSFLACVARELKRATGIDMRGSLGRFLPLHLPALHNVDETGLREPQQRSVLQFFLLRVVDSDFAPLSGGCCAASANAPYGLRLQLSDDYAEWRVVKSISDVSGMVEGQKRGKISEALRSLTSKNKL